MEHARTLEAVARTVGATSRRSPMPACTAS